MLHNCVAQLNSYRKATGRLRRATYVIAVNLYTLAQTTNLHVPSMGPHPREYTGVHMQMVVPTPPPPPNSITGQSYTCNTAISKSRNTATPHYSASRVSAMLYSQLQKTVTSHCSAVRTHTTSDGHTLTPHYSSGRTHTPPIRPLIIQL
jgi:hypothetical protein